MLTNLQVRDFAIVDQIGVEFDPGMTVLTGETGAGKSILVDALGLVLGDRGGSQVVRSGAKRAEFSAEFDVSSMPQVTAWLEKQALEQDGPCLLRRVISADGRSRAFINGNAVTVQQLRELGEMLLDIHGQHFHQSLGRKTVQRDLLDHFGGLQELRGSTEELYDRWQSLLQQLQLLEAADADRVSRLDLLTFQLNELEALGSNADEIVELQAERQKLLHSGRLADGVARTLDRLADDDRSNATALLAEASKTIESLLEFDAGLASLSEMLESAAIQVAEASDSLHRYGESIDMDPARRDWVEERLDSIQALARKHRVAPQELPELCNKLRLEHDNITNAEVRGAALKRDVEEARSAYLKLAGSLSKKRGNAAIAFAAAVTDAMDGLGMSGGEFRVGLENLAESAARRWGVDDIEFLISANPGQPLMPLSRVASGGELSRMSLAIQVIASDGSSIPTMVFDEVDSGVGGRVAEMVGRRLRELGGRRQVFCVTHLAQVASLADQHFRVSKVSDGKATRTSVRELGEDERIDEIARMLGGLEITSKTLEHAAEMLTVAKRKRA